MENKKLKEEKTKLQSELNNFKKSLIKFIDSVDSGNLRINKILHSLHSRNHA